MTVYDSPAKAVGKKVVLQICELADKSSGGIYIPDTAKDKHRAKAGIVVSVGPSCELGIKVGDKAYFEEFAGSRMFHEVYVDGTRKMVDYLYIIEDAILGVEGWEIDAD